MAIEWRYSVSVPVQPVKACRLGLFMYYLHKIHPAAEVCDATGADRKDTAG